MAKIIDHQVYYSIQKPTFSNSEVSGKIVYANRFAPGGAVQLPEKYRALLNSSFGFIGTNIIMQLNNKVQSLPNGPWYVDTRENMIYIHNRKFCEMPIYAYVYNQENSELLKAEFRTDYIRKHHQGEVEEGIDPDKSMCHSVTKGDIPIGKTPAEQNKIIIEHMDDNIDLPTLCLICACNDQAEPALRNLDNNLYVQTRLAQDEKDKEKERLDSMYSKYAEWRAAENKERGSGNKQLMDEEIDEALNSVDVIKERDRLLREMAVQLNPKNQQKALNDIDIMIKVAAREGRLEEFTKKFFKDNHSLNTESWSTSVQPYQVVERNYTVIDPNSEAYLPGANREYDELATMVRNKEVIIVHDEETKVNSRSPVTSHKVRYFTRVKSDPIVPQYRVVLAAYAREFGIGNGSGMTTSDIEAKIIANANQENKEKLEKQLTVKLEVVGNPFIDTSKIIAIANVGKVWSGAWYIKSVSHQISAGNGYTTQIELVKNKVKPSTNSTFGSVSLSDIMIDEDSTGSGSGISLGVSGDVVEAGIKYKEYHNDRVMFAITASKFFKNMKKSNKYDPNEAQPLVDLLYTIAAGEHVDTKNNTSSLGNNDKGNEINYNFNKIPKNQRSQYSKQVGHTITNLVNNTFNEK